MSIKSEFKIGDDVEITGGKYKGCKAVFIKAYERYKVTENGYYELYLGEAKVRLDDGKIATSQYKFLKAFEEPEQLSELEKAVQQWERKNVKFSYDGSVLRGELKKSGKLSEYAKVDTNLMAGVVTLVYESRGRIWANVVFCGECEVVPVEKLSIHIGNVFTV